MLDLVRRLIIQPRRQRMLQDGIFKEALRGYDLNREGFPDQLRLPPLFGAGLPERAVELMMAKLLYRPGESVLDLGHANAMPCHRRLLDTLPPPRRLTGLDIAEPVYDTSRYYTRSLREDITRTSLPEETFDQIWCISTLEHFGMDNSAYTSTFERDSGLASAALSAMIRLLKCGGRLLITVPFGRLEDHGSHINYNLASWSRLLDPVRPRAHIRLWYFRHTQGAGWTLVAPDELALTGYYDQANSGAAGLAVALLTKQA